MRKLKEAKEIIVGVVILILVLIGGSIYNGLLGGLWHKLINFIF